MSTDSHNSLDLSQSLPERVSFTEPVPNARGVGTSDTCNGGFDTCFVCGVADMWVSGCGIDCPVSFHELCFTHECTGDEDPSNSLCPYCYLMFLTKQSESLREKVFEAEKALFLYLDKEVKSKESGPETASCEQELQGEESVQSSNVDQEEVTEKLESSTNEARDVEEDSVNDVEASKEEETDIFQETGTEIVGSSSRGETNTQQSNIEATSTMAATLKTMRDFDFFDKNQRRRILWTSEEEEMLTAGVEKFAQEAKKNIPWRKILEMGVNVFHESRTPSDLKDKWRNMLKAAARAID